MLSSVVASVVEKVFPVGTKIHMESRVWSPYSRYWVIPGKMGEPRWVLPHDPRYALPFLKQWRPYVFRSYIKWKLLMVAYRSKRLDCVPGVAPFSIVVPQGKNWDHLGWSQADLPIPLIYVGTPSPHRKAVFCLTNFRTGRIISIGKVPLGPIADLAINREANNLDQLTQEKPGRAPRTIFVDRQKGISTQEFIAGAPTCRRLTERHIACLVDLAIPDETTSLRRVVASLEKKIQAMENIEPKDRAVLMRSLGEADDPSPLPAVWEHGDFVPWNLKIESNGSLRIIDWEESSRDGIPSFDLVYFHLIQALELGEKELFPKLFMELLNRYFDLLGIIRAMTEKIIRACVVRCWLRFHEANDGARADFFIHRLNGLPGELS